MASIFTAEFEKFDDTGFHRSFLGFAVSCGFEKPCHVIALCVIIYSEKHCKLSSLPYQYSSQI